jgi:hypothetical protein
MNGDGGGPGAGVRHGESWHAADASKRSGESSAESRPKLGRRPAEDGDPGRQHVPSPWGLCGFWWSLPRCLPFAPTFVHHSATLRAAKRLNGAQSRPPRPRESRLGTVRTRAIVEWANYAAECAGRVTECAKCAADCAHLVAGKRLPTTRCAQSVKEGGSLDGGRATGDGRDRRAPARTRSWAGRAWADAELGWARPGRTRGWAGWADAGYGKGAWRRGVWACYSFGRCRGWGAGPSVGV